ncbi:MAG TPA: hypothetical protein VMP08_12645, partial [Anaerolineae bacterium]|nr:hypothetical protein [Anaerolineae bacterium]
MRRIFTSTAPTVITGIAGLIVLITFIVPLFLTKEQVEALKAWTNLRMFFINIAVIVAGMALLLGFFRLLNFHLRRVQQRRSGYSAIALVAALLVFV